MNWKYHLKLKTKYPHLISKNKMYSNGISEAKEYKNVNKTNIELYNKNE